jgi:hypothetical protein
MAKLPLARDLAEVMESLHRTLEARKEAAALSPVTVFDKLKLAHIAFPAVVVIEPVTPLIAKKDTLL